MHSGSLTAHQLIYFSIKGIYTIFIRYSNILSWKAYSNVFELLVIPLCRLCEVHVNQNQNINDFVSILWYYVRAGFIILRLLKKEYHLDKQDKPNKWNQMCASVTTETTGATVALKWLWTNDV